ncbi:hypothetical protein PC116_g31216 [Phytophthora cactorum]|nr:hypothetical protein PC116_g31216 [Phytophthora cactorum]
MSPVVCFCSVGLDLGLNTLKSSSSTSKLSLVESGCSKCSPGGEDTGSKERFGGRILFPRGVTGESIEVTKLVPNESPKEGTLSNEAARVEKGDANALSLFKEPSSSSSSSGGLSNTSIGLRS